MTKRKVVRCSEGENALSSLQPLWNTHIHMSKVLPEVACSGPFPWLWEGEFFFAGVPEFDEGVGGGWVGGDVD
jgi:hypothetical protein